MTELKAGFFALVIVFGVLCYITAEYIKRTDNRLAVIERALVR